MNGEPALVLRVGGVPTGVIAVMLDEGGDAVRLLLTTAPTKLAFLRRQESSLS